MASHTDIVQRVVESILAQKLRPGERLGESELADLFGVSRTLIREALMQVQARGHIEVRSRKGWFVVEPTPEQARDEATARAQKLVGDGKSSAVRAALDSVKKGAKVSTLSDTEVFAFLKALG